ncbi:AAA family ATPase [Blastopirellula sp. JC732]|uniref:AAA family ATPase n=1 Tax=Blastopirellula sediminis TaxID=2894196 RepID=A0A9X1MRV0_9BACT|nr:AAA family ATPase [Blastopirellula sediminis]MCC9605094.1 AAA family ATPase [Blastopirellula sediminis]MCC9631606.1 AAA family ATPase [Blastopirellula sediminis]
MTQTIHFEDLRFKVDFAILTIREDEFEAVFKRFSPCIPVICGKQNYEYRELKSAGGGSLRVVITRTYDQGHNAAHSATRNIIDDLHPKWIVLAGIAGGVPDTEFTLGDVLIANSIHDLSVTAEIENKPVGFRPSGGMAHPAVERLLSTLPAWRDRLGPWNHQDSLGQEKPKITVAENINADCYYGEDDTRVEVQRIMRGHFPDAQRPRPPIFKIGTAATSNVLLKNTRVLREWKSNARQITHIEMELGGAYSAARHGTDVETPLLSVRGISDIVGYKRDHHWTQFACDSAASFLHAILTNIPIEMFFGTSAEQEPIRELDPLPTPTIDEIVAAFGLTSQPLLTFSVSDDAFIHRPEQSTLVDFISNQGSSRVLFVLGPPGCGKTALLARLTKLAIDQGATAISFKADLLDDSAPFANWGKNTIGKEISAIDAIKAIASRTRVVVVVDQLDALASTVDLTSDRLNRVVAFIHQCSTIPQVSVVCSCRTFEYEHDTRLSALSPTTIELELPNWESVSEFLNDRGISENSNWADSFRKILRNPQHLHVFLKRFIETGKTSSFDSYQAMLDELWTRRLNTPELRDLAYRIAEYAIENETLWMPQALLEGETPLVEKLCAEKVLRRQGFQIGFEHQTLLEHAKARHFTKTEKSICEHVLERQDAILVRPTIWTVLHYLRSAHTEKYHAELTKLFHADLRSHVRYLLIDFLGVLTNPDERESLHLANQLKSEHFKRRVLIAIRGNKAWFDRFYGTHFPAIMNWNADELWPMLGILLESGEFAREECFKLVEAHWSNDASKDDLTRQFLQETDNWTPRKVELARKIIRRAKDTGNRTWWIEDLVYAISSAIPDLAPLVFLEAVTRDTFHSNILDRPNSWHELPAVAEAAPTAFLTHTWEWFSKTCDEHHRGYQSSIVWEYTGYLPALDDDQSETFCPVTHSIKASVLKVAETWPQKFLEITRSSWESESAPVHRLIAMGLTKAASAIPHSGLEYLLGDRRRLWLGNALSDDSADSKSLIHSLSQKLDSAGFLSLEAAILSWSQYIDPSDVSDEQTDWSREKRLILLKAIPTQLLTDSTRDFIKKEEADFPNWNETNPLNDLHWGRIDEIPQLTKDQMKESSDQLLLACLSVPWQHDRTTNEMTRTEDGWTCQGGARAATQELIELSKEDRPRVLHLLSQLLEKGVERPVADVLRSLADSDFSMADSCELIRQHARFSPASEQYRSQAAYLLYKKCEKEAGFADDICTLLFSWLQMPWDSETQNVHVQKVRENDNTSDQLTSFLWHSHAVELLQIRNSFWPLVALTNGLLLRKSPDFDTWLKYLNVLVDGNLHHDTWTFFCRHFRWIGTKNCNSELGEKTVAKLFRIRREIRFSIHAMRLVASISDSLSQDFVQSYLSELLLSDDEKHCQAYGELLALLAFRGTPHDWAITKLNQYLELPKARDRHEELVFSGIALTSASVWDETAARQSACNALCRIIPLATNDIANAVGNVFWATEDFSVETNTELLIQAFCRNPGAIAPQFMLDAMELFSKLLPDYRHEILEICRWIVENGSKQDPSSVVYSLYEPGPILVNIAMTLQRFQDTRANALSLLEELMRIGLDDAFKILNEIDIRPIAVSTRKPRPRRRRKRR